MHRIIIQNKKKVLPLGIFLFGVLASIIIMQFPAGRLYFERIDSFGLFGAFFSGMLYAAALTSSMATIIFAGFPDDVNPFLVAFIGGLGSVLYDLFVFTIFHSQRKRHFIQMLREKMSHHRRLPNWLLNIIGWFVLASPLPDELAAGLLGFTDMTARRFMAVSFLANTVGIFLIIILT